MEKIIRLPFVSLGAEPLSQNPIRIRGHHIRHYKKLANNESPANLASHLGYMIRGRNVEYAVDVLGRRPAEAIKFIKHLENVFNIFVSAPASHPVELLETPGDICGGCIIGRHCHDVSDGVTENRAIIEDRAAIDQFLSRGDVVSEETNRIFTFEQSYHTAVFSGVPPQQVRKISTIVGDLRTILTYGST